MLNRAIWWIGDNFVGVLILVLAICVLLLVVMQIQYSTASCEELINYHSIGDMPGRCLDFIKGAK